ncbi:hypothetical protein CKK34_3245 [Yarrowia sp. E02]|nr:hypothetical protein CKK34_3245 [Yarrowia sp. E02]
MFNNHLQINVIRSPIGEFTCFSPLSSVLTSYPWTPKTAIAWTALEEGRFFDPSFSTEHVTNPNVAMLRLNQPAEEAPNSEQGFEAASGLSMDCNSPEDEQGGQYKEPSVDDNIFERQNSGMPMSLSQDSLDPYNQLTIEQKLIEPTCSTSLLLPQLPTPDTSLELGSEELDTSETSFESTEDTPETYMDSIHRMRELYARSYPSISLPPLLQRDSPPQSYQYESSDSSGYSPTPSPTLPSLTSVLGDYVPHRESEATYASYHEDEAHGRSYENETTYAGHRDYASSDYGGSSCGSDSTYSPGSAHSSPGAIYSRGARKDVIYSHPRVKREPTPDSRPPTQSPRPSSRTPANRNSSPVPSSSRTPPPPVALGSAVEELKRRGLWEDAQKKKRGKLSCSECGKFKQSAKYNHAGDLAKHMDEEHKDLSHRLKCPHIDCAWGVLGFVSLTEQKRHIKALHESQPIQCEICSRKLQRQDGFIRHMRDVHGISSSSKPNKLPHRKTSKKK